jgi:tRNA(Ile)-lysidine synthase
MARSSTVIADVERGVGNALEGHRRVVLAVSGGADSMVLMHAVAAHRPRELLVATFDHRTGPAATAASALVASEAAALGLPSVIGRAPSRQRGEANWRGERWKFLREVATAARANVATAHTRDDQLETVFIRALRHAGPRGLAGLYAESDILRPLLSLDRTSVRHYARERGIPYVEDPSNQSRDYLRNRVRLDILPRLSAVHPDFGDSLLSLSRRAAEWREKTEMAVAQIEHVIAPDGSLLVKRAKLRDYEDASLRILWPVLASRVGLAMDWRGTHRLAEFTIRGETGRSIQLSGGFEVSMSREHLHLRRRRT